MNYKYNKEFVSNFSLNVFNDSSGLTRVNCSGRLNKGFDRYVLKFDIKGRNKQSGEYDQKFMRGTIDSCNIQKGMIGNFILQMVIDRIDKYSNYRFECPQKVGFYYVYDFPVFETFENMPALVRESWEGKISSTIRIKVRGRKSSVLLFSSDIYGAYDATEN